MPATKALLIILAVLAVLFTSAGAIHLLTPPEQATAGKDTGAQQSQQPAAQPETQAPPQETAETQPVLPVQPSTVVPSYDVVRIEKGGEGVIAGRAQPDWRVIVQSGGNPVAEATADRDGEWVAIVKRPLSPGEHSLSLHAYSPNGNRGLVSDQTVVVSVAGSSGKETVVALAQPGKPTQIIQRQPAAAAGPEAASRSQETTAAQAPEAAATSQSQADGTRPSAAPPPASRSPEPEQKVAATPSEPSSAAPESQEPGTQAQGLIAPVPQAVVPTAPAATPEAQEERTGSTETAAQSKQAPQEQGTVSAPPAATSEPQQEQAFAPPAGAAESQQQQAAASADDSSSAERSSAPASPPKRQGQVAAASASGTAASSASPSAPQEPAATPSTPSARGETTVAKTPPADGASQRVARAVPADERLAPAADTAPQATAKPEAQHTQLAFDTVDYEDADASSKVFLSGVAEPGAKLMIYLNNDLIADVVAGGDGKWTVTQDKQLAPGSHVMRADHVRDDGKVMSRAEITFERAPPASVVASLEKMQAEMKAKQKAEQAEKAAMEAQRQAASSSASAPTEIQQPSAAKPKKRRTRYTVRRGDTLWDIAERHYGKGWRYTAIYRRNRDQIRSPHLIYPNQRFRVSR